MTTIKQQIQSANARQSLADQWAGERCTLNGKQAAIGGRLNKFATITTLDTSESAEYNWYAVALTMEGDGNFYTYGQPDQRGYIGSMALR